MTERTPAETLIAIDARLSEIGRDLAAATAERHDLMLSSLRQRDAGGGLDAKTGGKAGTLTVRVRDLEAQRDDLSAIRAKVAVEVAAERDRLSVAAMRGSVDEVAESVARRTELCRQIDGAVATLQELCSRVDALSGQIQWTGGRLVRADTMTALSMPTSDVWLWRRLCAAELLPIAAFDGGGVVSGSLADLSDARGHGVLVRMREALAGPVEEAA